MLKLPTFDQADSIQFMRYNFVMGLLFVISKKDVYCYNIFTNELVEKITFDNNI